MRLSTAYSPARGALPLGSAPRLSGLRSKRRVLALPYLQNINTVASFPDHAFLGSLSASRISSAGSFSTGWALGKRKYSYNFIFLTLHSQISPPSSKVYFVSTHRARSWRSVPPSGIAPSTEVYSAPGHRSGGPVEQFPATIAAVEPASARQRAAQQCPHPAAVMQQGPRRDWQFLSPAAAQTCEPFMQPLRMGGCRHR